MAAHTSMLHVRIDNELKTQAFPRVLRRIPMPMRPGFGLRSKTH